MARSRRRSRLRRNGGIAYATIPDSGGVVHTCYTKSSGAWRVIDTGLGQSCKANELPLDMYSKGGADALFLDSSEADALYLGKTAKATDSDKLDGLDSLRYVKGADAILVADLKDAGDNQTALFGHQPEGAYPGMQFWLECDKDGGTVLRTRSDAAFLYWWDGSFGNAALVGSQYEASFAIGNGSESHDLWSKFTNGVSITTLDLKTSVGGPSCHAGFTLLKTLQDSPGP